LVAELQQVTDTRALSAKFVQKPQDKSADAVLEVVLLPSYVLYSAVTVNSVTEFFKPPEEEQELDFTGLTAAASSQLERARRMAAEYAAAALSNKPRLKMKLDLEAPKISIPVQDGKGDVSVALDLGRFVIESDAQTAASLPSEEAGLYECIRLSGRNVSVYVVDGLFDWARQSNKETATSTNLVPILQRCKLEIGVQAARYSDPRFPRLRLSPTIPVLHFHVSPGRLARMLRVMNAVMSAPSSPAVHVTSTSTPLSSSVEARNREAWKSHADCHGLLKILTWTGIGRSTASWVSRYTVLYRGKLYLYEGKHTEKTTEVITTWPDKVVLRVPPEYVRGVNNVLAVRPAGPSSQDLAHLMEDSDNWLLRFGSEEEASKWYRELLATQHRLDDEVRGQSPLEIDWDASSVSTSVADESEDAKSSGVAQGTQSRAAERSAAIPSPPVLVELDAQLGECAIFASGREPRGYWPPTTEDPEAAESLDEGKRSVEYDSKQLDNEICLVVVRATQGTLGFKYGEFGMTIQTSLGSFEIRDMLLGKRSPSKCFLACSSSIGEGAMAVEDEIFFDPVEPDPSLQDQAPRTPRTPIGRQASGKQDLAEFTFTLRRPGFPEYQGTDSALDVKLNKLYFFCNRPTVAALISMGMDLGAAMSDGFASQATDSDGTQDSSSAEKLGRAESIAAAVDLGAMQATGSAPSETNEYDGEDGSWSDVPAGGDGGRTMFALNLSLEMVQVVFNYEGYEDAALVSAGINDFTFRLATTPDGAMYTTSSLGNLVAEDCTLQKNHPYRQACGLREGRSVSLVELGFDFHPRGHSDQRVPQGMEFYSLRAKLSELQLVFLYRLVQQVTQYLVTMLAMRLPGESVATTPQGQPAVEGTDSAHKKEEPVNDQGGQQPLLLVMDVEMDAPIITVPASSNSLDALDVDLGSLHLSTSVVQNAGQEEQGGENTGLFEMATLTFSGVGCSVIQAGVGGHSIIKNPEQGWKVQWCRSLNAEHRGSQPLVSLIPLLFFVFVLKVKLIKF
jgi:vacuolar protein sorting-associated protein 13A/C